MYVWIHPLYIDTYIVYEKNNREKSFIIELERLFDDNSLVKRDN